jgi:catechol 2,3-dioxygenase-like lactoylglutathione lyase family enzyme
MTQERPMLVGAATVFIVRDIAKSIEHYRDALGFSVNFQYGQPTFYACLLRDEVALHLLASDKTKQLPGNGGICVREGCRRRFRRTYRTRRKGDQATAGLRLWDARL